MCVGIYSVRYRWTQCPPLTSRSQGQTQRRRRARPLSPSPSPRCGSIGSSLVTGGVQWSSSTCWALARLVLRNTCSGPVLFLPGVAFFY